MFLLTRAFSITADKSRFIHSDNLNFIIHYRKHIVNS